MLSEFSDPAGQTHADVLDTGSETHPRVPRGMGHRYESIGEHDLPGDIHFVKDDSSDRYFDFCVSGQSVGHNEGGAGSFVGKPVIKGLKDMIYSVGTPAFVEGAGFGQEGESIPLFHSGDDGFDEIRRDMSVVVALPHVELDRYLVLGLNDLIEFRSFDKLLGSGKPFPVVAAVRKLDENDSGFFDGGSSWFYIGNNTSSF